MTARVARPEEQARLRAIRHEVFVRGQGVPLAIEQDGRDPECTHLVVEHDGELVGTARMRIVAEGVAKAERVAVLPSHQGLGLGRELMDALEREAAGQGLREVVLGSQIGVVGFYEVLGYRAEGEVFVEADIPHRTMRKRL